MPTSLILEDEVQYESPQKFRKILTRSRAKTKPSTNEDVGGEKFTWRHVGRLSQFFTKLLQVGKRGMSEKVIFHLHFMPFRSHIES
jgi:hypothetical protein